MVRRCCSLLIVVSLYSLYDFSHAKAQSIIFPTDNGGYVTLQQVGNLLELFGAINQPQPPNWISLIEFSGPACAQAKLVEKWDCNNPERFGYRSLFYYYRFLITFEPKCEGELCVYVVGHPEYGRLCFNSRMARFVARAEIRDACDHEVNHRLPAYSMYVDMDEAIEFYVRLSADTCGLEFPEQIMGRVFGTTGMHWVFLDRQETGSCYAVYGSARFRPRNYFAPGTAGYLSFTVPYGRGGYYLTYADEVEFCIEEIVFQDSLPIENYYGDNAACFPDGDYVQFGMGVSMDIDGWPPTCLKPKGTIFGYRGQDLLVITADTIRGSDFFYTIPDSANLLINGPYEETVNLTWQANVDDWDLRVAQPPQTRLRIFHAFRADTIKFNPAPPDTFIYCGDTLHIWANPKPALLDQDRVEYIWHVTPTNPKAHFRYNYIHNKNNEFWSDTAGVFDLSYTVRDTANGYEQTSSGKRVRVLPPKITITAPANGAKLTFATVMPGTLLISATAQTYPAYLRDGLVWSLTPITGSTLTYQPPTRKGRQMVFNYSGLPSDNNQFGRKYLKASLPKYSAAESIMVKVYYPKYAANHPGGITGTPNWYYYWGQTPANLEPDEYGGTYCNDSTYGYFRYWWYSAGETMFHICDLASMFNVSPGYPSHSSGIDCFGEVCLHEHNHYANWWNWWGNHQYDSLYADRDHDYIPSVLEPSFGLDSTQSNTDHDLIDDFEEIAYDAMRNWIPHSIDTLDWANPGHQY